MGKHSKERIELLQETVDILMDQIQVLQNQIQALQHQSDDKDTLISILRDKTGNKDEHVKRVANWMEEQFQEGENLSHPTTLKPRVEGLDRGGKDNDYDGDKNQTEGPLSSDWVQEDSDNSDTIQVLRDEIEDLKIMIRKQKDQIENNNDAIQGLGDQLESNNDLIQQQKNQIQNLCNRFEDNLHSVVNLWSKLDHNNTMIIEQEEQVQGLRETMDGTSGRIEELRGEVANNRDLTQKMRAQIRANNNHIGELRGQTGDIDVQLVNLVSKTDELLLSRDQVQERVDMIELQWSSDRKRGHIVSEDVPKDQLENRPPQNKKVRTD
ncbi:hypothetical protein BG015_005151 [Linnemannia schmuckeri]|uniref:Uncharacterized protein n=1 Tax=Linnemannia schmuckeri TaxID=64567 RepID=A0A9P5S0Z1_9FUNG|nr:hypothetical protein BG015_005151 [Linnemannia schmuckeri]